MMKIHCPHVQVCEACPRINLSREEEAAWKQNHFSQLVSTHHLDGLGEIQKNEILDHDSVNHRIKMDFGMENGKLGLWNQHLGQIADLPSCELLHPRLLAAYQTLRSFDFGFIQRGSFRLRISPDNKIGLWLDISHLDTQKLLTQTQLCHHLTDLAVVEVGQRLKSLQWVASLNAFKLRSPQLHPWFETQAQGAPLSLSCFVGSFTQPSFLFQQKMNAVIEDWLNRYQIKTIFEYGCGIGNWTLAMALGNPGQKNRKIYISESDQNSLMALQENIKQHGVGETQIVNLGSSFHHHAQNFPEPIDLAFVNPSRSGLGKLASSLKEQRPKYIIYISCFPETLIQDMLLLKNDYQWLENYLVNQFPLSNHYEVLSLWKLKTEISD